MANGLTNLIGPMFAALDVVSRELVGFIPSVGRDSTYDRAAVNQTVYSFVAPPSTPVNITPGVTPPDSGDQTIGNVPITITNSQMVPIRWNGEQQLGLSNAGPSRESIQVQQMAQAIRALVNAIETTVAQTAILGTSRAYGTPGTTPFASDLSPLGQAMKILDDNGAPQSDRKFVMNTTAAAKMMNLTQLTSVNQAGDAGLLRQGILGNIFDFDLRKSAQIQTPAIGTSSNTGTTNTAGYAIGSTVITLAAAGTGTILAGDFVSFTGDANLYEVATGVASLAAGGTLTLNNPGLQQALATSAITVTVSAKSARNIAFTPNAFYLATRLPALPKEGDLASDRTTITDPRSGLAFELAMYPMYREVQYQLGIAWGAAALKPEHAATIFG